MRIFKIKGFVRFQRKERITDADLIKAIQAVEQGLIDADLGGGLIKQRIARRGQGKSGGYRVIIAYRQSNRVVFLFGFAKKDKDNLDFDELAVLRRGAARWLSADDEEIKVAEKLTELMEINYEET